ncbi:hypothetical protein HMPREF2693_05615 [Staphylococcus sp. HMSC068D08]|uniref:DUF3923 family protein n=1 Tax=Staphylococcus TaxID=1279 RepID=UPI0008A283AB|nr:MULTISPECIES: DUF3923 family protein [Staphylococcus]MCC2084181.1 DUF3923 family protein [Staphylococcus lugdunensis]MCH8680456.1 DUF3923 family protein [Staphylococcus lugdunensis]MCI2827369.1 DUF3923 family protein [Staphylococcus lugdunensis]MCI2836320.1 DUF3923 family protein [Staphylococcus lugdunensis]MCM3466643.1 DUF3923 family protein [Staphylococcus lugdunensis]
MKTSWIIWWIVTVFWMITFAGMSLAILIRKVDGSGMIQSPEARMYALIVLLIAYIIPFIIQIVWLIINIIVKYRKR